MANRQDKINRGEKPTLGEELNMGINNIATILPGVDDALMGAYDYGKAKLAKVDPQKTFVGSPEVGGGDYIGLGDAATGGKENLVSDLLNTAEIPLMLFGGMKAVKH
jgi:hypothetical protein